MSNETIKIEDSESWSDEAWFIDQENRTFIKNSGRKIINEGVGEGIILGGNLCTLNLLQGTEYMPNFDNIILMIEDDELTRDYFEREFDRNLQSLLHSLKGKKINGLIVGRSQLANEMNYDKWKIIFETKKELKNIPIIIDTNFGHTTPIFTYPIGGYAYINNNEIIIENK